MEKSPLPNHSPEFAACCAKCRFAKTMPDAVNLKTMYRCMWGPPTPILMIVQNAPQIQSVFPVLDGESSCHRFEPAPNPVAAAR